MRPGKDVEKRLPAKKIAMRLVGHGYKHTMSGENIMEFNHQTYQRTLSKRPWPLWTSRVAAVALITLGVAPFSGRADDGGAPNDAVSIRTLSSRPNLVSGGSSLVQIELSDQAAMQAVRIFLNAQDVTSSFRSEANGTRLTGLVTGLNPGNNALRVVANGASLGQLQLTDYSIKGPIVSGPQIQPFICQTQTFKLPDGTFLGAPLDSDCSAPTVVTYVYLSTTSGTFQPLPSTATLPGDVAMTTTSAGATVPYVVRVETGTINRGIYQNAILFDPTSDPVPSPFSAPKGWNHRLIAIHGAGCPGGWYTQGTAEGVNVLQTMYLSLGYALFINTLQNPSNSCNPFVAGESAMMGKEHFIKTFGVPDFTLSTGGSGGAYTSQQVADAFPGLIDGIFINATFPDAAEIAYSGLDGHLLTHYFTVTNPAGFTDAQQVAVSGYAGHQAWYDAANQSQRTDPVPNRPDVVGYSSAVWNAVVPVALRYDPIANPHGARPTIFDVSRNIYGVDSDTGFALRAFDNVGVQYGLGALNRGLITKAQFLDLNQNIGGYDQDANYVSDRAAGNLDAIKHAYQAGVNLGGGGGLRSIPIIDFGYYNEAGGYHYQWHHFAVRERLIDANGDADNHVLWRGNDATNVPLTQAFAVMSQWVEAIKADHSEASLRAKLIRNKPSAAVDGCYNAATPPQFIAETQTFSSLPDSQCNTLWPSYAFPRYVAGGPLSADILKCQLKPIDAADYAVSFTPAELAQLEAIFPHGVCDWSKAGVRHVGVVVGTSFGPAPPYANAARDASGDAAEHSD
jgi:hypothetical protein